MDKGASIFGPLSNGIRKKGLLWSRLSSNAPYLGVDQVDASPGPQELHHHVVVCLAAGQVQGGLAVTVEHVQLRPGATHQPHDHAVTLECRVVQRPPARVIPVILIQTPVKQNLNKMCVSVLHK